MAFTTGYIVFLTTGPSSATLKDIQLINTKKIEFQKHVSPRSVINFSSIYFSHEQMQLIDPIYVIKGLEPKFKNVFSSQKDCFSSLGSFLTRSNIEKVLIWEEYRCSKRGELPVFFFKEAPFIHPSGMSYALLAFLHNKNGEQSRDNVLANIPYFHLTELKTLIKKVGELGGVYNLLSKLSPDTLAMIAKGQGTILTKNFLLAKISYPSVFSILEYRFYLREDLESFFKDSPYVVSNHRPNKHCFYLDGEICFDHNIKYIFKLANKSLLVFLFFLFVLIVLIVWLLIVKIKNQRLEDERRKLALQILTHEFRTPVTSLLLLTEKLNNSFDSFDDETSETVIRISGEVYRMQRLIQTGREYIEVLKNSKLITLKFQEIPSINNYFEELLAPMKDQYGEDLKINLLPVDASILMDCYWPSICIRNLLRNAFLHGKLPVDLSLELSSNCLVIDVKDCGQSQFHTLNEMTGEFVKGNKSVGTGLGLNIVQKTMIEMKGSLEFEKNPTVFRLKFKRK